MNENGPILILEDDPDDQEILEIVFQSLKAKNVRKYFSTSEEFLDYLHTTGDKPLIIFSDINMVRANGIDLKRQIERDTFLRSKTIPYIFLTTSANPSDVLAAYDLNSQGFFVKSASFPEMIDKLNHILAYWKDSLHPNNIG